ncbi:MAG: DUF6174 domain-containing protein [Candidatus Promineifilaceae bacterium]
MSELTLGKSTNNKHNWLKPVLLIVFVAAVAVTALALSGTFSGILTTPNTPDTPQALWESQEINSYRYTLQVGCFCMTDLTRPVTIEVQNGEVASITYADDGSTADPALFERYDSIGKLFAVISDAESQNPSQLDVTYDETYGVPLSVSIDISEMIADEELYLQVSNFESLR